MWNRIVNIWRKELTESLRDRKALTQAILIPIVIGVFYAAFNPWISSVISAKAQEPLTIATQGIENADARLIETLKAQQITLEPFTGNLREEITAGTKSAGLIIPEGFKDSIESERPASLTLLTNRTAGGIFGGGFSGERLDLAISAYSNAVTLERVQARNIDPSLLAPVKMEAQDLATSAQLAGVFAAFTLPILLASIVAQGGLFVAIDVTAGEKERGTLESVLLTPASDFEVFIGKLAAVFTFTMIPVVLTFMGFYAASNLLPASMTNGAILPISVIISAILLSLPLALFFGAALMIVSVRTKAFKDAQQAATPLLFLAIVPSMIAAFVTPTNPLMYLIPIYGPSALVSSLAIGAPLSALAYVLSIIGSLVAAAVCIFIGLRVFNRERLLYGV